MGIALTATGAILVGALVVGCSTSRPPPAAATAPPATNTVAPPARAATGAPALSAPPALTELPTTPLPAQMPPATLTPVPAELVAAPPTATDGTAAPSPPPTEVPTLGTVPPLTADAAVEQIVERAPLPPEARLLARTMRPTLVAEYDSEGFWLVSAGNLGRWRVWDSTWQVEPADGVAQLWEIQSRLDLR